MHAAPSSLIYIYFYTLHSHILLWLWSWQNIVSSVYFPEYFTQNSPYDHLHLTQDTDISNCHLSREIYGDGTAINNFSLLYILQKNYINKTCR